MKRGLGAEAFTAFPDPERLVLALGRRRMFEDRVGGTKRTPPLTGALVVVTGTVVMTAALGVFRNDVDPSIERLRGDGRRARLA